MGLPGNVPVPLVGRSVGPASGGARRGEGLFVSAPVIRLRQAREQLPRRRQLRALTLLPCAMTPRSCCHAPRRTMLLLEGGDEDCPLSTSAARRNGGVGPVGQLIRFLSSAPQTRQGGSDIDCPHPPKLRPPRFGENGCSAAAGRFGSPERPRRKQHTQRALNSCHRRSTVDSGGSLRKPKRKHNDKLRDA